MTPAAAHRASVAPARACAHRVLRRVFERGAYAEKAFLAEAGGLDARDRSLAMRLSYGGVQRRGTSDHLIARLAGRPAEDLDGPVLASLRLGLYELLYLAGAPDYAVVADAVELAKGRGGRGHGLVNAVLRRALREGPEQLLDGLGEDTPAEAAIKHSHPEWIAGMWWRALGADQARALMARDNEPAEVALRANTLVTDAAALAAELPVVTHGDPAIPEALVLEAPFDLHASPLWASGALTAQSRAAMLIGHALAPRPGERVLDLCAAPGGKTTHLAALMEASGELVAVERNPARARGLERTARRMRAANVRVVQADAQVPLENGTFDRVLVDPPCSGLGTLQARADLRWRASPAALEQMREQQFHILNAAAESLRPGGLLLYSTCTVSPSENERLIAAFLNSRTDFGLDHLAVEHPGLALASARDATAERAPEAGQGEAVSVGSVESRTLQTLPHRDLTAGFFIARLRRS